LQRIIVNELGTQLRRGLGMGRHLVVLAGRSGRDRLGVGLAVLLAAACCCLQGAAQTAPEVCCKIPLTPRVLNSANWNYTSTVPLVVRTSDTSILYMPRAGVKPMQLNRCSQHYHCHIENVQECPLEVGGSLANESTPCPKPKVGTLRDPHRVSRRAALHPDSSGARVLHAGAGRGHRAPRQGDRGEHTRWHPRPLRPTVGGMVRLDHQRGQGAGRVQAGRVLALRSRLRRPSASPLSNRR
jgi:hypothetical protein